MSELAEAIRELSKDKVPFNWESEHQAAFQQMKKEISCAPVLSYYNSKKQTMLQTDASIKGLGACLLEEEKPVYFASKALTEAVTWAMEEIPSLFICQSFHPKKLMRNCLKPCAIPK